MIEEESYGVSGAPLGLPPSQRSRKGNPRSLEKENDKIFQFTEFVVANVEDATKSSFGGGSVSSNLGCNIHELMFSIIYQFNYTKRV
jgi:hypothetical protein